MAPLTRGRAGESRDPLSPTAATSRTTATLCSISKDADAISFGTLFLANHGLVARFLSEAPINAPDMTTLYSPGPGSVGYTDYPFLTK